MYSLERTNSDILEYNCIAVKCANGRLPFGDGIAYTGTSIRIIHISTQIHHYTLVHHLESGGHQRHHCRPTLSPYNKDHKMWSILCRHPIFVSCSIQCWSILICQCPLATHQSANQMVYACFYWINTWPSCSNGNSSVHWNSSHSSRSHALYRIGYLLS